MYNVKSTSISILGFLSWKPLTGYEIKQYIENSVAHFWNESYGQLYPELTRLSKHGLIVPYTSQNGKDTRNQKRYAITELGKSTLQHWIAQPPRASLPQKNELLLKIFFSGPQNTSDLMDYLTIEKANIKKKLASYLALEASLLEMIKHNPMRHFQYITLKNGLTHAKVQLEWCEETLAYLKAL